MNQLSNPYHFFHYLWLDRDTASQAPGWRSVNANTFTIYH